MNSDDLDPATKARIEAEEKYRAQVRGKIQRDAGAAIPKPVTEKPPAAPPPTEKKEGVGCVTWVIIIVGLLILVGMAQQFDKDSEPYRNSTINNGPSDNERLGSFGYTCEKIVKDNIKAPSTAEFGNYYTDQREGGLTGTFASGYTWRTYVDAENSFGAKIRTRFTCTTEPGSETVRVAFDP